jgi:transcriptional accessory protein Tex/SPT6
LGKVGEDMEEYKNLEEIIKLCEEELKNNDENVASILDLIDLKELRNLIKAYKEKDKDNNDLRRLYRRTAIKLKENGKEELADYFLAQINEVPTFTVEDDIDYYSEYHRLKEENEILKNVVSEIFNSAEIEK